MKRRLLTAALLVCAATLQAQTTHRDSVLAEARYLKSIYRTDDAIEKLSALVQPGAMDEGVLAELADCHFQSGAYEDAVGTYFLLSSKAPDNILYHIRLMQAYSRLKAYSQSIHAGRAVLQRDSIPAVLSFVGDSFRQLEQVDSALWYYRRSLAQKPMNETVLSKAVGILIDKEKYDEAIAQSEPFLAEDPDNMTIAPLQGLAYYRKGDYETASKIFQRQEDIGNDTYPIHYYLGQSYWHTLVIYRAEQELQKAWQIDSSDVNLAYSIAAQALAGQGAGDAGTGSGRNVPHPPAIRPGLLRPGGRLGPGHRPLQRGLPLQPQAHIGPFHHRLLLPAEKRIQGGHRMVREVPESSPPRLTGL